MDSLGKSSYAAEREVRVAKAWAHTSEMFLKYGPKAGDVVSKNSRPGFESWETEGRNSLGQVIWEYDYPMPYSGFYNSFFLRLLRWGSSQLLLPHLEECFAGDVIDTDYIEGLLIGFEELASSFPGRIIIADDGLWPRIAGPSATFASLNESERFAHTAYIEWGGRVERRIALVRGWLDRKRASQSVSPDISTVDTSTTSDLAFYLIDACPITICDNAAVLAGLRVGCPPNDFRDLRVHAFTEALKATGSLQAGQAAISDVRQAVASRYGVADYRANYKPQHNKHLTGRNAKWDDCQTKPYKFLNKHYSTLPRPNKSR